MGISNTASSSLTSLYRSGCTIPWQVPNSGKHADGTLIMIKPNKADKILHLIYSIQMSKEPSLIGVWRSCGYEMKPRKCMS